MVSGKELPNRLRILFKKPNSYSKSVEYLNLSLVPLGFEPLKTLNQLQPEWHRRSSAFRKTFNEDRE